MQPKIIKTSILDFGSNNLPVLPALWIYFFCIYSVFLTTVFVTLGTKEIIVNSALPTRAVSKGTVTLPGSASAIR